MGRGNVDFFGLRFHAAFCNLLVINVSENGAWPRPAGKVTAKGKGVRREAALSVRCRATLCSMNWTRNWNAADLSQGHPHLQGKRRMYACQMAEK